MGESRVEGVPTRRPRERAEERHRSRCASRARINLDLYANTYIDYGILRRARSAFDRTTRVHGETSAEAYASNALSNAAHSNGSVGASAGFFATYSMNKFE